MAGTTLMGSALAAASTSAEKLSGEVVVVELSAMFSRRLEKKSFAKTI